MRKGIGADFALAPIPSKSAILPGEADAQGYFFPDDVAPVVTIAAMLCEMADGNVSESSPPESAEGLSVPTTAPVSVSYHFTVKGAPGCMPSRLIVPATGVGV